jgi:hypothetical protein
VELLSDIEGTWTTPPPPPPPGSPLGWPPPPPPPATTSISKVEIPDGRVHVTVEFDVNFTTQSPSAATETETPVLGDTSATQYSLLTATADTGVSD